jgi:hypothetical protein
MVALAKERLKYKAALHPILFELLPQKFTLPQLQCLYEGIYGVNIDKRNFSRKIISTGLLLKQKDKEKHSSKKGAFYYKLDKKRYSNNLGAFLNIMPNALHISNNKEYRRLKFEFKISVTLTTYFVLSFVMKAY